MRTAWFAVVALVIALVLQLSVLNGLQLPGGGVPDLVLVLVAALAMAEGPVVGMAVGFATGLCLDLAPPGGAVVGQYALVFCLVGWAAGRLSQVAGHSGRQSAGLLATALLAVVVAAAEVLSTVVGLLVAPGSVTLSQIRVILPSTIGYDVVLCPFVLSLVMLAAGLLADRSAGAQRVHGIAHPVGGAASAGALAGTARSPRARRRAGRLARLRPGSGVPGSASGLVRQRTRPAAPVHLRLASGRRGDGVVGGAYGAGGGLSHGQRGRHPGQLAVSRRQFRPHPGEPGGSAVGSHRPAAPPSRPQRAIKFSGRRGDGSLGHPVGHGPAGPGRGTPPRRSPIRFAGHRGDGSLGHPVGPGPARRGPATAPGRLPIRFAGHRGDGWLGHPIGRVLTPPRPATPQRPRSIRFVGYAGDGSLGHTFGHSLMQPRQLRRTRSPSIRFGSRRDGQGAIAGTGSPSSVGFGTRSASVTRRSPAVPRFSRKSVMMRPARLFSTALPGGALTTGSFRPRPQRPTPQLRLSGGAPGMLGGTGRGPRLGKPAARSGKQPRFSYGKHSPLSALIGHRLGRRLGGGWLARWRVGSRSGVWLVGRRPEGLR